MFEFFPCPVYGTWGSAFKTALKSFSVRRRQISLRPTSVCLTPWADSDLYHPNREQRRWVLPGRSKRETEVDVFTSTTARNKNIAGNPHRPKGFERNGIVFVVVAASQCRAIYSLPRRRVVTLPTPGIQHRLAATLLPIRVVQATSHIRCPDTSFPFRPVE